MTPLHMAAHHAHLAIVNLLLRKDLTQLELQDNDQHTPLHLAVLKGHTEIVRFLLDKGANTKIPNKDGLTPLHLAVLQGHAEIVRFLLDEGATSTIPQDKNKHTPFSIATQPAYPYPKISALLVSRLSYWEKLVLTIKKFFKSIRKNCLNAFEKIKSFVLMLLEKFSENCRGKSMPTSTPNQTEHKTQESNNVQEPSSRLSFTSQATPSNAVPPPVKDKRTA